MILSCACVFAYRVTLFNLFCPALYAYFSSVSFAFFLFFLFNCAVVILGLFWGLFCARGKPVRAFRSLGKAAVLVSWRAHWCAFELLVYRSANNASLESSTCSGQQTRQPGFQDFGFFNTTFIVYGVYRATACLGSE